MSATPQSLALEIEWLVHTPNDDRDDLVCATEREARAECCRRDRVLIGTAGWKQIARETICVDDGDGNENSSCYTRRLKDSRC